MDTKIRSLGISYARGKNMSFSHKLGIDKKEEGAGPINRTWQNCSLVPDESMQYIDGEARMGDPHANQPVFPAKDSSAFASHPDMHDINMPMEP